MDKQTLNLCARYNVWATEKLVTALKTVSDEDFVQDQGLFFKSIFATLNHILVGEHYLWFPRFNGQPCAKTLSLNSIIEHDRALLFNQLIYKSKNWISFLQHVDDSTVCQNLSYISTSGQQVCVPFSAALLHVFNHGTHHRGQITAALTAMGYPCPALDLIYMLMEGEEGQNENRC